MDTENIQAAPVDCRGAGVDIGEDPFLAAGAGLTSAPQFGSEVGHLALYLGPGACVGLLPGVGFLVGLMPQEDLLMEVDADGPPRPVGGAGRCQRAGRAGRAEAGQSAAIATPADRGCLAGGAGDRLCLQVDV